MYQWKILSVPHRPRGLAFIHTLKIKMMSWLLMFILTMSLISSFIKTHYAAKIFPIKTESKSSRLFWTMQLIFWHRTALIFCTSILLLWSKILRCQATVNVTFFISCESSLMKPLRSRSSKTVSHSTPFRKWPSGCCEVLASTGQEVTVRFPSSISMQSSNNSSIAFENREPRSCNSHLAKSKHPFS